ncbi:redoxin domain-containing protein [Ureibacillus sp. Re31]|uniref:Redoxin domain-containing protein n=1 Tax=Ureibacillus galli TaxID=2762222 RepID=A0ABR8XBJ6_9BACL|nr:redoxin domain-containing protein [Ureibacillus galli]MBD8026612.1 redoxin domain-containing protein [Ureibacillus galli]
MKLRSPMPELKGETKWLNGTVTKQELIGRKPTLIHFWSVSCHLCKEIMPEVIQLRDRYRNELNVIAVHMPRSNEDTEVDKIKKVTKKYKISHPVFIDNSLKLSDAFENEYVPAYYVFDKYGLLRHYQSGGSGMKMLEKRINKILAET